MTGDGPAAATDSLGERGSVDDSTKEKRERKGTAALSKRLEAVEASLAGFGRIVEAALARNYAALKGLRANQKGFEREFGKVLARLAAVATPFDPAVDQRFLEAARPLIDARHTMLDYDRLYTLWQSVANVMSLSLPAVEIGTFRGGSAALIASAFRVLAGADRELHVVDTFAGHLEDTFTDHDNTDRQRGKFQETTADGVRALLGAYADVHVHPGDAATVVESWPERRYCLVHLDVDLYQPTLACLTYFGARLAPGGIIVIDDYESPTCPGVARAVREYVGGGNLFQLWRMQAEQVVLIRR